MHDREYFLFNDFIPKKGDIVLDLGANVGCYTFQTSKRVGQEGRVISVEPYPINHSILEQNIKRNKLNNVTPFKVAVSSKNSNVNLFISLASGSHSLHSGIGRSVPVESLTFSTFLKRCGADHIDIMKMDIEGSEIDVLRTKNAFSKIYRIVMETHENAEEARMLLSRQGYFVTGIDSDRILYARKKSMMNDSKAVH